MKILLVEDDELLRAVLVKTFETNRYLVDVAEDGQTGLEQAIAVDYDLLLLDVQLPRLDGLSLCRQLRSRGYHKPILLLTANDSDADAIAGFEAGADDYISKPCAPNVLLARMRTLLRRSGAISAKSASQASNNTLTWGTLRLDLDAGRVTVGRQIVALTATEYNLLELFLRNPDRIFSRSAILDKLWGFDDAPTDRAIVTHVKDVRKKLKASGLTEDIIETVYGMGYRLKAAPQSSRTDHFGEKETRTQQSRSGDTSAIAGVLAKFQRGFSEQVAILERANTALKAGNLDPELQQAARHEAHKLAGSLAPFGYPNGSKLARSIEQLLMSDGVMAFDVRQRFSELVVALQQELAKAPSTVSSPVASPNQATQTYEVLVIDDDIALTEQLKVEAKGWGVRLEIALTLTEARSRLNHHTPDVILLDLSFPEAPEDGVSFLQSIMGQTPNLPVIVFTGRDSLADRLTVSRLGARQFLHKPATTEQIFRAIARVLPTPHTSEATVLIVDDDPAMLTLLSNLLTPWGLKIVTLKEPQQFWQVLLTTSPNLILLDLEMPHISGLELCQVVRQDTQWGDLPILVVTAYTDATSLQKAFAAGADDFITKPVLGPELVSRVLSRIERTRCYQKGENSDHKVTKEN